MSTLTYLDSGVLISAVRGNPELLGRAFAVLDDPDRRFACSEFVRLEIEPKAAFNRRDKELAFYTEYFAKVQAWAPDVAAVVSEALRIARTFGLAAVDALHVAAAIQAGAAELITTEKPDKPIHRVTAVRVVSLQA